MPSALCPLPENSMDEWITRIVAEITIEDLPESYREIAGIVGVENAVKLSEYLGGLVFYFPQLEGMLRRKRDARIKKEFNGANHKDLARKYGLTERWIREIVDSKPRYDQLSLL